MLVLGTTMCRFRNTFLLLSVLSDPSHGHEFIAWVQAFHYMKIFHRKQRSLRYGFCTGMVPTILTSFSSHFTKEHGCQHTLQVGIWPSQGKILQQNTVKRTQWILSISLLLCWPSWWKTPIFLLQGGICLKTKMMFRPLMKILITICWEETKRGHQRGRRRRKQGLQLNFRWKNMILWISQ